MTRTVRYSFSVTCSNTLGCVIAGTTQSFVGHVPSAMVATLDASAVSSLDVFIIQAGGVGNGTAHGHATVAAGATTGTGGSFSTIGSDATSWHLQFNCGAHTPAFGTHTGHVDITWSDAPVVYCEYGTQVNPSASQYTFITSELISAIAIALGWGVVVVAGLQAIVGMPLLAENCSTGPPAEPVWTSDDFVGSTAVPTLQGLSKFQSLLQWGYWHFYCQCTPAPTGGLAPIAEPNDATMPPPLTGTQPDIACNDADICATLVLVRKVQDMESQQLRSLRNDIALLLARPSFSKGWGDLSGYTKGTVHSSLSGIGAFAISALDGFEIEVTTRPAGASTLEGNPPYLWNAGWVSLSTVDAMEQEKRITQLAFLWFPPNAPMATFFNYEVAAGNVIRVTELHRT